MKVVRSFAFIISVLLICACAALGSPVKAQDGQDAASKYPKNACMKYDEARQYYDENKPHRSGDQPDPLNSPNPYNIGQWPLINYLYNHVSFGGDGISTVIMPLSSTDIDVDTIHYRFSRVFEASPGADSAKAKQPDSERIKYMPPPGCDDDDDHAAHSPKIGSIPETADKQGGYWRSIDLYQSTQGKSDSLPDLSSAQPNPQFGLFSSRNFVEDDGPTADKFSVSVAGDGVAKQLKLNYVGAIGFTFAADCNASWTGYVRADDESHVDVTQGTQTTTPLQKQFEFGVIWRFDFNNRPKLGGGCSAHDHDLKMDPDCQKYKLTLDQAINCAERSDTKDPKYNWIYVQPLDLQDDLRHSRQVALDARWVPLRNCINRYVPNPLRCQGVQKNNPGSSQYMLIADMRIEVAHFMERGLSLAAPVSAKGAPLATYLPNQDYIRLGGRIGAATKLTAKLPWYSADKGTQFVLSAYYRTFTALSGVRHKDLGEAYVDAQMPIGKGVSVSLSYKNGRSEHIAAREQGWTFGLVFK